jgi:hypothetical protein
LTDQTFAQAEAVRDVLALFVGVRSEQLELELALVVVLRHEERAMLRAHHRRQLGEHLVGDGEQIALALQHAREAGEVGLQPVLLEVEARGLGQRADHLVDVVFEQRDLAARVDRDRLCQVAFCHRGGDVADRAHLTRQVACQLIHVVSQVAPDTCCTGHVRLTAELTFDTHVTGHAGHLLGEGRERDGHGVDGVDQGRDLALGSHGQLLIGVAVGDRGHDAGDAAHLLGEVTRHQIDVVSQVAPHARDSAHLGLTAEHTLGTDLARNARDLGGKGVQLIDHGVDRALEL